MNDYHIKPIDRRFNVEMLDVLHGSPIITKKMTICFDRQPDIFALPQCKYDRFFYKGLFHGEALKGFGMVGYHDVLVNGVPTVVFCARDLYVLPEARGQGFVPKSTEAHFRDNRHLATLGYGVIIRGNQASMRMVGKRPATNLFSPFSAEIGQLAVHTIYFTFPVSLSRKYFIRRAKTEDIPAIVELLRQEHQNRLFGRIYTEEIFHDRLLRHKGLSVSDYFLAFDRQGRCCGVCAAWDMHQMKQTRILRYGTSFIPAKIGWNVMSVMYRRPSLPRQGEAFREISLIDYAVKERDPEIMNALLRAIYHQHQKLDYHYMTWGGPVEDPMLKAVSGFQSRKIISNIVLFSTDRDWLEPGRVNTRLPFIDISAL